jgi:hypothetical protein
VKAIRLIVAALLVSAGVLVSPQLAEPADAASVDVPVHEWNTCGAACNFGSQTPANVVYFAVAGANPRPWTIALNEVCLNSNQYSRMVNFLDDLGYHANYYTAARDVSNCGGSNYGNVVFASGPRLAVSTYAYIEQDGDAETRGVVCNLNGGYLGDWQACSTHLDNPRNSSTARIQEGELYNVAALGGCRFAIYGGDFNIDVDYADLDKWRSSYDEIDEVSPWAATTDSGHKIDYSWARDCGAVSSPYAVSTSDILESDHHYYGGRFRLFF